MGSQSERTPHQPHGGAVERAIEPPSPGNKPNGLDPARVPGLPQKGDGNVAGSRAADRYSPNSNPVDSAALPLRKTNIRNVVTTPVLSAWSMAEQGDVPNRMHREWWDGLRSQCPG